jgi:hypothetical protein
MAATWSFAYSKKVTKHFALPALLALFALTSCVSEKEKAPELPAASIKEISPALVMEGTPFNVQPNGVSALSVLGANLVKGSRIKLNGMPLETASGDGTSLAAVVPPEIFAKAGNYIVTVETPDGRPTNSLAWRVLPKSGPAPAIAELFPDKAQAGKPFNVQPNGVVAMGLTGINFLPGAKISMNGKTLDTNFGNVDQLAAIIPPDVYAKPGKVQVVVTNPDGKQSPPKDFTVNP